MINNHLKLVMACKKIIELMSQIPQNRILPKLFKHMFYQHLLLLQAGKLSRCQVIGDDEIDHQRHQNETDQNLYGQPARQAFSQ